jgi:transcriptional regulator with XRE-family HTH domain
MGERERWQRFGEWLRRRREGQGLARTELAKRAGIAYQTVATFEAGGRMIAGRWVTPNLGDKLVNALAGALGIDPEELRRQAPARIHPTRPAERDVSYLLAELERRVDRLEQQQRRSVRQTRLEEIRAGLAAGKTPEQLGLRLLDPKRIAARRRAG